MQIASIKAKDILIDTHTSVKTPIGFFPGTSEEPSHIIKPDVIILLEYSPKDIIARRKKDRSRSRDAESEEDIEEHQMSSRYYAFSAALHAQCAVKYVNLRWKERRPFEHTDAAADEIVKLFNLQR
jgi:adenylate kinase